MIKSKEQLKIYLAEDKKALNISKKHPSVFKDEIWKFQICLRKVEYWNNCRQDLLGKLVCKMYKFRFHKASIRLGFTISPNCFEEGLSIAHYGCLVVHGNARIGQYCRIQDGVTIGATNGCKEAAKIGSRCFIGSGAKIIGNIKIVDNVSIGAGAVVINDILEPGTTWAGVPAKKISNKDSSCNLSVQIR